ncbi:MAG TPA: transglutaminase-like domain-containing protein [Syntrophorhabdaceae bacterium]|nr:transglutaminase-like domain-containing protein [Syntrophorhabdaceae bacterium]HOL06132.1 transglutaminase-like domain-containing protein [Syntrophorhabdaceae bacterium]HPP41517.1 transglutaminase-like domain-containing protein [Syntrophorhabdaceae bacterium]
MDIFLRPTHVIDSDNKTIIDTVEALTSSCKNNEEKAVKLFYFVRDQIHYSVYMLSTYLEDFIASTVLARKKGYCVQKAVLLAALARAAHIPSRLAFARIKNHKIPKELIAQTGINVFPSHGYTQLFLNNRWVSVTPAFDKGLCRDISVPAVEFDGINNALLPAHDLEGRPYIEYIEKYEPQADLPFEWLRGRLVPIWGEKHAWLEQGDSKGHRMPSGYVF